MNKAKALTYLDLPATAGPAEIRKAYYTKAAILHPDKQPGQDVPLNYEEAKAQFQNLQEAYTVLTGSGEIETDVEFEAELEKLNDAWTQMESRLERVEQQGSELEQRLADLQVKMGRAVGSGSTSWAPTSIHSPSATPTATTAASTAESSLGLSKTNS